MTTRTAHVEWAKERAMEYVETGDPAQAMASLFSDLRKHPETTSHAAIELGAMLMFSGNLSTTSEVRDWIEGVA